MTERPNIRRMQVPSNERQGVPFDIERDISPEMWAKIGQHVKILQEKLAEEDSNLNFDKLCAYMADLATLEHPTAKVAVIDANRLMMRLNKLRTDNQYLDVCWLAANAQLADHEHAQGIAQLESTDWIAIRRLLDKYIDEQSATGLADVFVCMSILGSPPELSGEIEEILSRFTRFNTKSGFPMSPKDEAAWRAKIKLIVGKKAPTLTRKEWQVLREELRRNEPFPAIYANLAKNMKILVAKDALATPGGIKITMPERSHDQELENPPESLSI